MMGNYHVRFGGGPTEKGPRGHLAGGLPYNNGTGARWLEFIRPVLAVASVGKGNGYGHPGSETLALLARSGIPLLRTDREGTIVVESDGRRWGVVGRPIAARSPPAARTRSKPRRDAGAIPAGGRININAATQAELEALPGVGPVDRQAHR